MCITDPDDALDEEARLIARLRPRDNLGQPEEPIREQSCWATLTIAMTMRYAHLAPHVVRVQLLDHASPEAGGPGKGVGKDHASDRRVVANETET